MQMTVGRKPILSERKRRLLVLGYAALCAKLTRGKLAKLGPAVIALARDHGVSRRTFYRILAQFGTKKGVSKL